MYVCKCLSVETLVCVRAMWICVCVLCVRVLRVCVLCVCLLCVSVYLSALCVSVMCVRLCCVCVCDRRYPSSVIPLRVGHRCM